MITETDALIKRISAASDRYGDKLVEFMRRYDLTALAAAEPWQLREYIREERIT